MRFEHWFYSVPLRLRSLFRRSRVEEELDEELRDHLERQAQAFVEAGMDPEEARWAARRALGNIASQKEDCRDARGVRLVEEVVGDVRYALRGIRRNMTPAAVVVASLALGIGANTAIFSVLDAVLLARLPVRDPGRLVLLTWSAPDWPAAYVDSLEGGSRGTEGATGMTSYSFPTAAFRELERPAASLTHVFGFASNDQHVNVGLKGRAEDAVLQAVSGGYFEGMGVVPEHGRLLLPADDSASTPPVAVLSHSFWRSRLGGDPGAVGSSIVVNGTPVTVAGVAPPGFFGFERGNPPDLWVPFGFYSAQWARLSPEQPLDDPRLWWMAIVGRLKPGVTLEQAEAELGAVFAGSLPAQPAGGEKSPVPRLHVTAASRGLDTLERRFSTSLWLLMATVALLLAIACANVGGLLLARAAARRQEIATRLGLGAPRSRIVRQLLVESTVLALLGGGAGLAVAYWAASILVGFFAESRTRILLDVRLDGRALLFTAVVSLACGVLFGLAPALRLTRTAAPAPGPDFRRTVVGARSSSGKRLVAVQVGLSLVLLVGSGLMLGTLRRLQTVDVGFPRERLLVFDVKPGLNGYAGERLVGYYEELARRMADVPGVQSVAFSLLGPIGSGSSSGRLEIPGVSPPGVRLDFHRHLVGPGYFETLGVPLLAGRGIGSQDTPTAHRVAVVNRTFVEQYFHGQTPIGHVLRQGPAERPLDAEVVGIVGDVHYDQLRKEAPPTVYFSYRQASPRPDFVPFFMNYLVRTHAEPRSLKLELERTALSLDAQVPLVNVRTEEAVIAQVLFLERAFAWLTTAFGALALVLAAVGLYGTVSYTVSQRTNEIGLRMALGATGGAILVWALRQSALVVLAGLAGGVPLAWAATRLLQGHLFELSAGDPATLAAAVATILVVSLAATLGPALRASRVDPAVALRCE